MLRTQFDDIPDNELNDRIDRVRDNFHRELSVIKGDTESLRLHQIKVNNWFSEHLSDHVFKAVETGESVDIVSQLPVAETAKAIRVSTDDLFKKVSDEFRQCLEQRPGFGVWGWLTGDLKKQQTSFLNHLATKGGEYLEEANSIKAGIEAELQSDINAGADDYEALVHNYKLLTESVAASDVDGAIALIADSFGQDDIGTKLLMKPWIFVLRIISVLQLCAARITNTAINIWQSSWRSMELQIMMSAFGLHSCTG